MLTPRSTATPLDQAIANASAAELLYLGSLQTVTTIQDAIQTANTNGQQQVSQAQAAAAAAIETATAPLADAQTALNTNAAAFDAALDALSQASLAAKVVVETGAPSTPVAQAITIERPRRFMGTE